MRRHSHQRNKELLTRVANKLQEMCDDVTFVGGAIIGFLITDPAAPDVRFTVDVDCIINIVTHSDYYKISKKLREKGLKEMSSGDHPICRWDCDGVLVDIMPTDKGILGFSNRWYKNAISNSIAKQINPNRSINIISAPYFLATKLEAFHDRGKNDYLMSHDLEDIISVIDGRSEIVTDIEKSDRDVKNYISTSFEILLNNKNFTYALPGHLNYANESEGRKKIVMERMQLISSKL